MALSEIEAMEISVVRIFIFGLILVGLFLSAMTYIFECDECNCYTIPILSEWTSEEGYIGATKYQKVECSLCRDKVILREKEYRERKW